MEKELSAQDAEIDRAFEEIFRENFKSEEEIQAAVDQFDLIYEENFGQKTSVDELASEIEQFTILARDVVTIF
jgi:hypothetical protein